MLPYRFLDKNDRLWIWSDADRAYVRSRAKPTDHDRYMRDGPALGSSKVQDMRKLAEEALDG